MQREGGYGTGDGETDVVGEANLFATDPNWLIDHDPNLDPLTEAEYQAFEKAVSSGLSERLR